MKTKSFTAVFRGAEFKLMRLQDAPTLLVLCDQPDRIVEYLRQKLPASLRYNGDTENLIIVLLNSRRRAIGFEIISNGTLDTLLVHAREVFKPAIVLGASAIVVAHNHPSGDAAPSEADIKVTRDLIRAGQLLKIDVLDHVILGTPGADGPGKGWSSLRELAISTPNPGRKSPWTTPTS